MGAHSNQIVKWIFTLLFFIYSVYGNALRNPRQTGEWIIDTLVVVDEKMYLWFKTWLIADTNTSNPDVDGKLKEYLALVFHQSNLRYANIKGGLDRTVVLQIVQYTFNTQILGTAETYGNELEAFEAWLKKEHFQAKFDHSILFTGYGLKSGPGTGVTKGRAFVARMCQLDGSSSSIIMDTGAFQSAHTMAHEVGHSFGSVHDGVGESSSCRLTDRFIMSASRDTNDSPSNILNPWLFSSCSIAIIKANITRILSELPACISNVQTPVPEYTATAKLVAGQIYPPKVQCQMMHGPKSRVCHGPSFSPVSDICTSMFCMTEVTSDVGNVECNEYFAAEGTTCGNKKWCRSGVCEKSDLAPEQSETCPNGDSTTRINGVFCDVYVPRNPNMCYNDHNRVTYCCASCEMNKKEVPGCEYGDKQPGCNKASCGYTTAAGGKYSDVCCCTCSNETCIDFTSTDSVSCALRVQMKEGCYEATILNRCCKTCAKIKTTMAGCEYGDHSKNGSCVANDHVCSTRKSDCCLTCLNHVFSRSSSLYWTSLPVPWILLVLAYL